MPTYNGERYISEAIESALQQTFKDFELIVVDDGSTDGTASIVADFKKKDERIKYLYKNNGGVATACNFGIERSQAPYVAFFEHDDISLPERLEKQIRVFDENPQVSIVYSSLRVFHGNGRDQELFGEPEKIICQSCEEQFRVLIRKGYFFNNPSLFFKKDVWIKYRFDEQLPSNNLGHDYLFVLMASRDFLFYGIKEPLVRYRRSGSSLSSDRKMNFEVDRRVLDKLYDGNDKIFNVSYKDAISLMYLEHARIAIYSKILPHNIPLCFKYLLKSFLTAPFNVYIYKNLFGLISPLIMRKIGEVLLHKKNTEKC